MIGTSSQSRIYPSRPFLAVSAVIFRDDRILIVRRAMPPGDGLYTVPGGTVELGETLEQAAIREVSEETGLLIEPVALAGYRQVISRDISGRVERHYVILPFAALWRGGEVLLNEELAEAEWLSAAEIAVLCAHSPAVTTEGLAEIIAAALDRIAAVVR